MSSIPEPQPEMLRPPRLLSVLGTVAILVSACATNPTATAHPSSASLPPSSSSPAPSVTAVPFTPAAWPARGSACGAAGYTGRIGRIQALSALTIRFTLCAPDGAFLARIAHPALGILETATLSRLATDPATARSIAGTGPYRIESWTAGGDAVLVAAGGTATPVSRTPTVIISWAADATQRTAALQDANVDGIDAPGSADIATIETLPELALVPRAGLDTAYLAFGNDPAFNDAGVRRAIAGGLNRETLAAGSFPAGSTAATHLAPCDIAGACAGSDWYEFNAPASAAALATTRFDLRPTYQLHVPNVAVPGLPDPVGVATAVQAQLRDNLGIQTSVDVMDATAFAAAVADATLGGFYLDGVGSTVADPASFLVPALGPGAGGSPAKRAPAVAAALAAAAATADPGAREAAFKQANDAIRSTVPLIPLVHPGSEVAYRSDVQGVVASPLGIDPLGAFTPGDRPQLVFMQATDPGGAYCGDRASADAYRLCALVTEPLYGFAPGTLDVEPRLAERCSPSANATVWTCLLRKGVTFQDGNALDAGDVLATFVAQWDSASALRASRPAGSFAAWDALFGGPYRPD